MKRPSDKERLDWLTTNAWTVDLQDDQAQLWACTYTGGRTGYGNTPRAAIDAAMKAEAKPSAKGTGR